MAPRIVSSWRWFNVHSDHMLWKASTKQGFPWSDTLLHWCRQLAGMHHVTLWTNQSWEDCNVHYMCTKDMFRLNMMFWRLHVICDAAAGSAALRSRAHRPVSWDAIAAADGNPKHPKWRGWDSHRPHGYQCWSSVSLSVSSSLAVFLSISPVLIVQQHNWLHHVSEHHNCHIKHGWVCAHVYLCVCRWTCTALLKTTWMTFTNDDI